MDCETFEITTPIKRDELLRLLDTMAAEHPESTEAAAGIEADPEPAPPPIPRSSKDSSRAKRRSAGPFSHIAAQLPPCEPIRFPRATLPPPLRRATTHRRSLADPEKKAPRTVAEVRARLDSGENAAMWAAAYELSPQVVAHLSAEEIAMLPPQFRLACDEPFSIEEIGGEVVDE